MSIAQFLKDPETESVAKVSAPGVDAAAKLRKQVFGIFGSVVVLGLALTGWYVAYRIIAERGTQVSSAPAVVTIPAPSPVVSAPPVVPVRASAPAVQSPSAPFTQAKPLPAIPKPENPAERSGSGGTRADLGVRPTMRTQRGPFERHDLNPQRGEKYWQIAAYGPKSLDDYLKQLEAQGRHPLVAPGPSESIYRILVGPFKDADALEQARRSIEAMGIEPILRSY